MRNRLQEAEESLWEAFESDAIDPETLAFELNELQRDVPRNSYALYRTVASLVDTGQVE